jgi:hypothetical protein
VVDGDAGVGFDVPVVSEPGAPLEGDAVESVLEVVGDF